MDRQVLELHNASEAPVVVWIEPWGEELQLAPGSTWTVTDGRDPPTTVSVTYNTGALSIHVMPEARVQVMDGSDVVWSTHRQA